MLLQELVALCEIRLYV